MSALMRHTTRAVAFLLPLVIGASTLTPSAFAQSTLAQLFGASQKPVAPTAQKPPEKLRPATTNANGAKAAAQGGAPSATPAEPKAKPAVVARLVVGDPVGPDDLALRYYASQKQKARVNAELARLKRLYPDYEPPADLYEQPGTAGPDEEALWALYTADKLEDLKLAIARRQKEEPGYTPSADLDKKLRHKDLRQRIASFFKAEKFLDLVDYVKGENVDLGELAEDVDIVWSIGEAYARAKQHEEAVNAFKRVLTSSKDPKIRIATIQKAMAAMRMVDVEALLASVEGGSDVTGDFAPMLLDITRARIAAWLHDERARRPTGEDLGKFETYARDSKDASQLGLVAWYHYKRHDVPGAFEWFKLAIQNNGDATIAHGLAHTLRGLGRKREAEEVAYAWRDPLANNVILFIDLLGEDLMREVPPYIEPDRLARYAKVAYDSGSGEGAQALGWYAFSSCQFDVAATWFERAVALYPRESAVVGYALTLRKLKKDKNYFELANRYDGLFAKVIEPLFPDDSWRPPTPCDAKEAARYHAAPMRTGAYIVPGSATIPGAAPNYDMSGAAPKPPGEAIDMRTPLDVQLQRIMKTIKGKFPVAVNPENPLRFRPPQPMFASNARPPAFGMPVAPPSPFVIDPVRTPPPLIARRVPGIGTMPYERFGFSLLPGWNGVDTPSSPTYAQEPPIPGTPAAEQADPSRAGIAAFDSRFPTAARGLPPQPYPGAGQPPMAIQPMQQGQMQPGQMQQAPMQQAPMGWQTAPPGYSQPQRAMPAPTTPSSAYGAPQGYYYGQYPQPLSR